MTPADPDVSLVDGPWQHRFVSANGARFHVVVADVTTAREQGPLVLLLHGFPQFWWAWRHQLTALADAGHRVAAMDLRGFAATDKPPRGYDPATAAADVTGVVRSLGERDAVVVGHDLGGWLAWSMPALAPRMTRAVAAVAAAHPLAAYRGLLDPAQARANRMLLGYQVPFRPERQLQRPGAVGRILRGGSGGSWPDAATVRLYEEAVRIPFVAHSAMEYFRWGGRSIPRRDGRTFAARLRRRITVPVLQVHGTLDPYAPAQQARSSSRWVAGSYRWEAFDRVGHYPAEEAPERTSAVLLDWLGGLDLSPRPDDDHAVDPH